MICITLRENGDNYPGRCSNHQWAHRNYYDKVRADPSQSCIGLRTGLGYHIEKVGCSPNRRPWLPESNVEIERTRNDSVQLIRPQALFRKYCIPQVTRRLSASSLFSNSKTWLCPYFWEVQSTPERWAALGRCWDIQIPVSEVITWTFNHDSRVRMRISWRKHVLSFRHYCYLS